VHSELSDAACEDDPNYADECPVRAAEKDYCKDQEEFMRKHCPKSCGFCSEGTKPPAPEVCEDDPAYADKCAEKAAIEGFCKDHEDFMRTNCPKSCGYCSGGTAKPPFPIVCEDDPAYADKCAEKAAIEGYCKDHEDFMRTNCPKSCGYCSEATAQPPFPIVCEDDPAYADQCPVKAAIEGYCKDHEDFMRTNCRKSCGYCSEEP